MAHNIENHHENMGIGAKRRWSIFPKIAEIWHKSTVFKDNSQVAQNPVKTNGSL